MPRDHTVLIRALDSHVNEDVVLFMTSHTFEFKWKIYYHDDERKFMLILCEKSEWVRQLLDWFVYKKVSMEVYGKHVRFLANLIA